jgi:hypothetical protein
MKKEKGNRFFIHMGFSILLTLFLFLVMPLPSWGATPQISAGSGYTIAIKSDGTLWAWGLLTLVQELKNP